MKNEYLIQVNDLRHQVDQITPKKNQLFEKFNTDPANVNAGLYVMLIRHRQIEKILDGNKITGNKVL